MSVCAMPDMPRERIWRWLGLGVAALASFILVRIAVLNVFYDSGDLLDPGYLASVAWHNGWRLHGPPAFGGSYLSEHLSLIFWLTNAISYALPLDKFDFFAGFIAAIYALYAAGIYRAWQLSDTRVTAPRAALAVCVALAATFGGVGMVALRLPHQEMAIPALALWFFIAMAERTYRMAAVWFTLCLSIRADAGLHMFLLLALWGGVLLLLQRQRDSPHLRPVAAFAAVALGYTLLAFLAKRLAFPAGDNLWRSYLGNPPFGHLTAAFLFGRLYDYLTWRSYIFLPLALSLAWGILGRNKLLPLGTLATIPWLLLTIMAVHNTPGTFSYYYGFPFWLALAWPLVALRLGRETPGGDPRRWPFLLVLLASLVGWRDDRLAIYPLNDNFFRENPFIYTEALRHRAEYRMFVETFVANRALFGTTALDIAMVGLLIDHTDRGNWAAGWSAPSPDTLLFFENGPYWLTDVLPIFRASAYSCVYGVPGTRIQLAARDDLRERLPDPDALSVVGRADVPPGSPPLRC